MRGPRGAAHCRLGLRDSGPRRVVRRHVASRSAGCDGTAARPGWLSVAVGAEIASYLALGLLLRRLVGLQISRRAGVEVGLVVTGLGNVLPAAPAEGLAMAGAELRRRGVETRRARLALGLMQRLSIRTLFGVAALDALGVATAAGLRSPQKLPGAVVLASLALAVLALLAVTAWLASRRQTIELAALAASRLRFWRTAAPASVLRAQGASLHADIGHVLGSHRTQAHLAGLALLSFLAEATCFRCALVAVGIQLRPGVFLFAYAVAMITAFVPFVPAGLGVVETAVPALLHQAGVALPTALAGVLAYRAIGTLLPAVAAVASLVHLRRSAVGAVSRRTRSSG